MSTLESDVIKPAPSSAKDRLIAGLGLVKDAGVKWSDDNILSLGASLAYYAVFSIFPLLLLGVTVLGFVLGNEPAVKERLLTSVSTATSPEFRKLFDDAIRNMQTHQTARGVGALVGMVTLFVGASAVFSELESTLNKIWKVPPSPSKGLWAAVVELIRYKAVAFAVVVGCAVAMLASLVVSSVLSSIDETVERAAPSTLTHVTLWIAAEAIGSVGLLTVVVASMFRMIPKTNVEWRDVFAGALVTALLLTATKGLLAWYLGHVGSYAAYGTVGGFLGLLTWIYLASLFLYFGAEVSQVYAEKFGSLSHFARRVPSTDELTTRVEQDRHNSANRAHPHSLCEAPVDGQRRNEETDCSAGAWSTESKAEHEAGVKRQPGGKANNHHRQQYGVGHR